MSILPEGIEIKNPIGRESVSHLKAGNITYITGYLVICREGFFSRVLDKGWEVPIDFNRYKMLMTSGGGLQKKDEKGRWIPPKTITFTLGYRFRRFMPDAIRRFELRAVISKGSVSTKEVVQACEEVGCVYLAPYSMPWTSINTMGAIKEVAEVQWLDLGLTEAVKVYRVEKLGPYVVEIDTEGGLYYDRINQTIDTRAAQVYKELGIEFDPSALDPFKR